MCITVLVDALSFCWSGEGVDTTCLLRYMWSRQPLLFT
uniref:Uncharacterized protein n=1 Tax=Anguilla anguilla TaxID=7936 RepID=A0A0E9Q7A8_ANGAN